MVQVRRMEAYQGDRSGASQLSTRGCERIMEEREEQEDGDGEGVHGSAKVLAVAQTV